LLLSTYELGRQPFGLASPAAWLRGAGFDVDAADLAVSEFPAAAAGAAGLVAFYLPMHTATRLAAPLIGRVHELNPGAHLAAYGLYAPLNAAYLRSLGVGSILGGEFEAGLVRLARALAAGAAAPLEPLISLDRLDFVTPDRTGLAPLTRYARVRWNGQVRRVGSTEASRGCKHHCRHCPVVPVYEGTFRVVPPAVVLEDISRQVAAGAAHLTFGDPDFFNGPTHALRIVEALAARFPGLSYDVTIKIEHLLHHRGLLPRLVETGCLWVTSAVESTEDHVLEVLDKGHTRAGFLEALEACRRAGLLLSPTFLPFTPWSTLEGYRDLLHLLAGEDLVDAVAPIQLALRLLLPTGSPLLAWPGAGAFLGEYEPAALRYRWRHPDPAMDKLAAEAFRIVSTAPAADSRRAVFARLWEAAHGAPPENYDLLPRAAIPYLDEPWYC
jgi:hypothetical protein